MKCTLCTKIVCITTENKINKEYILAFCWSILQFHGMVWGGGGNVVCQVFLIMQHELELLISNKQKQPQQQQHFKDIEYFDMINWFQIIFLRVCVDILFINFKRHN